MMWNRSLSMQEAEYVMAMYKWFELVKKVSSSSHHPLCPSFYLYPLSFCTHYPLISSSVLSPSFPLSLHLYHPLICIISLMHFVPYPHLPSSLIPCYSSPLSSFLLVTLSVLFPHSLFPLIILVLLIPFFALSPHVFHPTLLIFLSLCFFSCPVNRWLIAQNTLANPKF